VTSLPLDLLPEDVPLDQRGLAALETKAADARTKLARGRRKDADA
jgi:hypothetical protein